MHHIHVTECIDGNFLIQFVCTYTLYVQTYVCVYVRIYLLLNMRRHKAKKAPNYAKTRDVPALYRYVRAHALQYFALL